MDSTTVIAEDAKALAVKCWEWLSGLIRRHQSLCQRPFALALAGGNTPRLLYEIAGQSSNLSEPGLGPKLDWQRVILLLGDERNVPLDHLDSNFRMVTESLLSKVSVPPQNVLAVVGAGGDPALAAKRYQELLYDRLGSGEDGFPVIDCVLLGLGDDVHTASLFPETLGLDEQEQAVIANYVDRLHAWRITLSVPAINAAKQVAFLIAGSSKKSAWRTLRNGVRDGHRYPAQLILPKTGSLLFFVDQAARGELPAQPTH